MLAMTTTHLWLDEGVHEARGGAERMRRGDLGELCSRGKSTHGALDCVEGHMRAHGSGLCACDMHTHTHTFIWWLAQHLETSKFFGGWRRKKEERKEERRKL